MMVEMSEIGISKDACIRHELFMGDLGGGPILDGHVVHQAQHHPLFFVFLDLSPSSLSTC